ncbi:MAG: class I SAM-dependent methyltransferase [Anaeromicrobium sp.]|jgi:O-methyltransferase involved in polyketide biosynthesis|uniref:class I SAM-dependent methyltransferase n=1 Tax=Anaeromicrobium sp. TaxID=1929132 RepID=UPI0025ED53CE|nr:class I SAM-dependent methyltransferase [Anaeromicrobium sp.]MCT4593799.1 class I SAM-dependent methyltransferase [Anaeromicrobium sp.]
MEKHEVKLIGVPETMLIPLWAKAQETKRDDSIIKDFKALEMIEKIDYDFSIFGSYDEFYKTQVAIAGRTKILDDLTREYIKKNPKGTIINMGAGLDTRPTRIDIKDANWYDIDLAEGISIRKKFINETDQHKFIEKSLFDYQWIDLIDKRENVLFIAEGIFMYFSMEQLKELFKKLADNFTNSHIIFEAMDPLAVGNAKRHESVKKLKTKSEFLSGFKSGKEVEIFDHRLKFTGEWYHMDIGGKRWKGLRFFSIIPRFKRMAKIIEIKIN